MSERSASVLVKPAAGAPPRSGFLQRKCACGAQSYGHSECTECAKKRSTVQRQLTIGASNDPLEAEADRIAERVLIGPARSAIVGTPIRVQRAAGLHAEGAAANVPASVGEALSGAGSPLGPALRAEMESSFGHDFSHVRVHTGAAAELSARAINANAYTANRDIVFGAGQFAPHTLHGRRLLAHELTHVVQQSQETQLQVAPAAAGYIPPSAPHSSGSASTLIQRDDAGGGSTTFKDSVSVSSRPTTGPGVISGKVTRTETAPAHGSQPEQEIHRADMNVRFDPSDCSITIPFGYNFVQAPQASSTGFCEEPPPTTKVPALPADRFNKIKAGVLSSVNRGLNGWFNVRLSGKACPGSCTDRALPIRVVASEDAAHPDTTITIVNRGGRANAGTICAGSWDESTAEHEGGHQVLGVGDEYPEVDERLRATAPQWFRTERVRRDYSKMGPEEDSRFAMFHERHFNAVKVFLEDAFPGCKATLEAQSRPVLPDYRIVLGGGYASLSGTSGLFLEAGLRIGIPLDRLRRWEVVLGPQIDWLSGFDQRGSRDAFLLGARFAIEGSSGGGTHGFTGGLFAEGGAGKFSSTDYSVGGAGSRSTWAPYGEVGLSAGYRTPIVAGSTRFDFRAEGAAGSAIGAPGVIGAATPDIESDPQRSRWFRLGVTVGGQF